MTALGRVALAACMLASAGAGGACELVLSEHRSGTELQRLPLSAAAPELRIAFEHSVLGTTVVDRYRLKPEAHLVEERFDGHGYGLPHAAAAGESLQRDGDGWRLQLDRLVHPLVVRPLPRQRMRLLLGDREWLLAAFSAQAIEFNARGCSGP